MSEFRFSIKIGDVIELNETIDDCGRTATVTDVLYDDSRRDRGWVVCECEGWDGEIIFPVDGSSWDRRGNFKREMTRGWDECASADDVPIAETFRGITYIKLGDIASQLVGHESDNIPDGRFDTIEEVYDFFCEGKFSWGNNDLTFVKLARFVQEFPFTSELLDAFDLTSESIYVLLEE